MRMQQRPIEPMFVERIEVQNFKSIAKLDVTLDNFNVLVGSNAAGKSNFIEIFNFLKHIATNGLEDAISMQGGMGYLQTFNAEPDQDMTIQITLKLSCSPCRFAYSSQDLRVTRGVYEFQIRPRKHGYTIVKDAWFFDLVATKATVKPRWGQLDITNDDGKITFAGHFPSALKFSPIVEFITEHHRDANSLLLEDPAIRNIVLNEFGIHFDQFEIYDFDPKLAKRAIPIQSTGRLSHDGSNLSIALKNVIGGKHGKNFARIITSLLPHVDSITTKRFEDNRSIIFAQMEQYFHNKQLPATLLSDGTINITALVLALYSQFDHPIIIEEPDRNIHPSLISQIVDIMKDVSRNRQIIVTTHNPEMVRYAGIDHILTVRRDAQGHSEVVKPRDIKHVNTLGNLGVEELFAQKLLGD